MSGQPDEPAEEAAGDLPAPSPGEGGLADVPLQSLGLLVTERASTDGAFSR